MIKGTPFPALTLKYFLHKIVAEPSDSCDCGDTQTIEHTVSHCDIYKAPHGPEGIAELEPAAQRALMIYVPYTIVVLLTFIPYALPNWELRSLVTVTIFGPLTLLQPLIVIIGFLNAMLPGEPPVAHWIFFTYGTLITLFFERILQRMNWAKRDAFAAMQSASSNQ